MALWASEPRGEEREDLRIAHQTMLIGNLILAAAGSKGRRLKIEDVLLRFDKRDRDGEHDYDSAIDAVMAALSASAASGGSGG